jgi:Holliday junction resolvase RusA-like endonuclease
MMNEVEEEHYPIPDILVASYVFHPPDRRKRDIDNFLAMMKNYQDGVCAALGIDDSRIKRTVIEWGDVCKGGKVVLTLTELEYEGEGLA